MTRACSLSDTFRAARTTTFGVETVSPGVVTTGCSGLANERGVPNPDLTVRARDAYGISGFPSAL
jgi:hypothetical protein